MRKIFRTYFTLIICLCLTLLFSTCKKYADGGFTNRGFKNIMGAWKLSLYEVNGVDSTDLINYNGDDGYKKVSLLKNVSSISVNHSGFNGYSAIFTDNNLKLKFSESSLTSGINCVPSATNSSINNCYRSFFIPEPTLNSHTMSWSIIKLTKKEIVLKSEGINSYQIKLSKQ